MVWSIRRRGEGGLGLAWPETSILRQNKTPVISFINRTDQTPTDWPTTTPRLQSACLDSCLDSAHSMIYNRLTKINGGKTLHRKKPPISASSSACARSNSSLVGGHELAVVLLSWNGFCRRIWLAVYVSTCARYDWLLHWYRMFSAFSVCRPTMWRHVANVFESRCKYYEMRCLPQLKLRKKLP